MTSENTSKDKVSYYGVTQNIRGSICRWIFDEATLSKEVFKGREVPDLIQKASWPIDEDGAEPSVIEILNSDEEIKKFLTAPGPDIVNPTLEYIGNYELLVLGDYGSCTGEFVKKFNLEYKNLAHYDTIYDHKADCNKMTTALAKLGYKDFDYLNSYHGRNKDMRYFDLRELYEQQVAEKLNLDSAYRIEEGSLTVNTFYDIDKGNLAVLACFATEEGDYKALYAATFPPVFVSVSNTLMLIDADRCFLDAKNPAQIIYRGVAVSHYETFWPRSVILDYAKKDKLSVEEIKEVQSYYSVQFHIPNHPYEAACASIVMDMINDGFAKDRIALIGKDWGAKEILQKPVVEEFYNKTRARLTQKGATEKTAKDH